MHAYAQRWAIERLVLHWKRPGGDLETLHLRTPTRVGRLVAGLAIATLWCLMIAAAHADILLADLTARAQRRAATVYPPHLPGFGPTQPDRRPDPAHFRLLSGGRTVIALTSNQSHTPARCWVLPHWQAPNCSIQCTQIIERVA